jgi:ATP-binding cassette, subfamily B, multidrug efflux pump
MLKEFRTLFPYYKTYAGRYAMGFLFLFITDAGQLYLPQLIRLVIDHISAGAVDLPWVGMMVLAMIGVAFLVALGRFGWRYYIHGASRKIEKRLRSRLFGHLLTLSPSFYGRSSTGDLMARATGDMHHVRMASGMGFVALFDGLFMTLFIITIIVIQFPQLALIVLAPFPLITLQVLGMGRFLGRLFKAVQEGYAALSSHVQEALSGILVLKAFVREDSNLKVFSGKNEDYKRRNLALVRLWGFAFPMISFLGGVVTLLLLRFGGMSVLEGGMSAGDFVAAMSYLGMLIWPMLGMGFTVNMLERGGAALARINAVLREEPEIRSPVNGLCCPREGAIEVRNLSFTYPGSAVPSLRDVSFTVEAGQTLGILGRTGAGKSTLIRLLPRLLGTPPGTVFIAGRDVRDYELSSLRSAFGVVPQETFLFSAVLSDNIAFGIDDAPREAIEAAAEASTISRDVRLFPKGYETEVGERGITLSGGQKQRIAISRALITQPEILIFDDALAAVDTSTEESILDGFIELRKGKTNILISHRVSTLKFADYIVVLDEGAIVQSGTHEELIGQEGFYAEIANLQRLEEEESA